MLTYLAEGANNSEIAASLVISPKTVARHRENIMRKLNLHSRAGVGPLCNPQGDYYSIKFARSASRGGFYSIIRERALVRPFSYFFSSLFQITEQEPELPDECTCSRCHPDPGSSRSGTALHIVDCEQMRLGPSVYIDS